MNKVKRLGIKTMKEFEEFYNSFEHKIIASNIFPIVSSNGQTVFREIEKENPVYDIVIFYQENPDEKKGKMYDKNKLKI